MTITEYLISTDEGWKFILSDEPEQEQEQLTLKFEEKDNG